MVKLIKLNSQNLQTINYQSRFTAYFQEDIKIKSNAKIALRNLQLSLSNVDVVDSTMGLLVSLQRNANGSLNNKTITIPKAEYSEGAQTLEATIYTLINSAFLQTDCPLIKPGVYNRVMWQPSYSDRNNFELSFKFVMDNYNTGLTTNDNISYNDTNLTYYKTANNDSWDFISSGNMPICLGTGTANFKAGTVGFCVGVNDSPTSEDNPVTFENMFFKIFTDNTSNFYKYQVRGESEVTTIIPYAANDTVEIGIEQGQFKFMLTRANQTIVTTNISKSILYDNIKYDESLSMAFNPIQYYCFFGLKYLTTNILDITWTPSPFYTTDETGIYKLSNVPHVVQSSLSDAVPSYVDLSFFGANSDGVAMYQMLGFSKIAYEINGVSGTFSGELSVTSAALPDGLYVVIDNIKLDSYDYNELQINGKRKNILANLTSYDFSLTYNIVKYETDDPIYIDILNKEEFLLNSISISIYDQSNNLLDLGESDTSLVIGANRAPIKMTLLIDG